MYINRRLAANIFPGSYFLERAWIRNLGAIAGAGFPHREVNSASEN
jgi:hypothetical protein